MDSFSHQTRYNKKCIVMVWL